MCHPGVHDAQRGERRASGRGVGLDAVRGFAREVGGALEATSVDGVGTTWVLTFPLPVMTVEGHAVRAPGVPFPIILDASWRPTERLPTTVVDLALALGLDDTATGTIAAFESKGRVVGILCTEPPVAAKGRYLVHAGSAHLADVILLDASEGLLIRPDVLL